MSFLAATDGLTKIAFGDSGNNDAGIIHYSHDGTHMAFTTEGTERVRLKGNGYLGVIAVLLLVSMCQATNLSATPSNNRNLKTCQFNKIMHTVID